MDVSVNLKSDFAMNLLTLMYLRDACHLCYVAYYYYCGKNY